MPGLAGWLAGCLERCGCGCAGCDRIGWLSLGGSWIFLRGMEIDRERETDRQRQRGMEREGEGEIGRG